MKYCKKCGHEKRFHHKPRGNYKSMLIGSGSCKREIKEGKTTFKCKCIFFEE